MSIVTPSVPADALVFQRGDSNADENLDISDGIATLGFLFLGGSPPPCQKAADANDDGRLDISDGIYGLSFSVSRWYTAALALSRSAVSTRRPIP